MATDKIAELVLDPVSFLLLKGPGLDGGNRSVFDFDGARVCTQSEAGMANRFRLATRMGGLLSSLESVGVFVVEISISLSCEHFMLVKSSRWLPIKSSFTKLWE